MIDLLYVFKFEDDKISDAKERLNCSIQSLKGQDANIIVFNASKQDISINAPIEYHHRHDPNKFNKPRLINYAVKNFVKSEYFIFSDIDLIYKPTHVQQLTEYFKLSHPTRIVFWNYNMFRKIYTSDWNLLHNSLRDTGGGYAHGNGLIHTKSFYDIHGYDEYYFGYGPEDDDFNRRINHFSKVIYDKNICSYHLYHERMNRDNYHRNSLYYKNRYNDMVEGKITTVNPNGWGEISDIIIPPPPPDTPEIQRQSNSISRHSNSEGHIHYQKRQIERHQSK